MTGECSVVLNRMSFGLYSHMSYRSFGTAFMIHSNSRGEIQLGVLSENREIEQMKSSW